MPSPQPGGTSDRSPARRAAFTPTRIALIYALVSAIWIAGSDRVLAALVGDSLLELRLQTIKGWAFVVATAVMLFYVVRGAVNDARRSAAALVESEAALRDRETLFQAIFEAAGVGILICDFEQRILRTNPAFDLMLGYEAGELVGRPVTALWDPTHPTSTTASRQERLDSLLAGRPRYALERRYRRKDGGAVPAQTTVTLVRGDDGAARYQVAVIEDLTERHRVEATLAETESRLRQAQKMEAVGRLAGGVAHDFNNLLTVILSNADLALDALSDATGTPDAMPKPAVVTAALSAAREELSELRGAAERAASVTQQLLAFSRKQVMQPMLLDLDEVVSGVERLVRRLIHDDVQLDRVRAASSGIVRADRGRMEQVVMNLVLNARDAMPNGGTLTLATGDARVDAAAAAALPGMRPGGYVTLSVRDTGTGMDELTHSHLFEPFFTTKAQGQGTGLGLSTVYGIVKQSEGFVYATSTPGEGSTFTVYLPRAEAAARAEERLPRRVDTRNGQSVHGRDRVTVLVVDDEPAVRESTRRLLERNGFDVHAAADGVEALAVWERDRTAVDLVLTDLAMPGMDGRELSARLRALDPQVRVLCMSGFAGPEAAGDEQILEKPFTVAELLTRVRDALTA